MKMRLIDADALIEFCAERWIPLNIDAVNMQPTIEPKRNKCNHEHCPLQYNYVSDDCDISECPWKTVRKQGHWIISSDGYYPYCSECKTEPKGGEMMDFCPSCGAYMVKSKN